MRRRQFMATCLGLASLPLFATKTIGDNMNMPITKGKIVRSDAEWKKLLPPAQYDILRHADTEAAFSSALNHEKRQGQYVCAGCDLPLFTSTMKFDSGTGWPSFFTTLTGAVETKTDFKLILPRKEYHCARCGGHQGHVFNDGPQPTGQRWCNNGLALKFIPA